MTDQLTRRELLQRGAAGGAALTIPGPARGFAAARPRRGAGSHQLATSSRRR